MKLDLLLAREPIEKIAIDTLASYLSGQFGWKGEIFWESRFSSHRSSFLVNSRLNLIFSRRVRIDQLRQLASEYSYHSNPVRRLLQGLYVRYSTVKPLRWIFTDAHLQINPMPSTCDHWCVLPGNHSIRIVDTATNECIVLRKTGTNKQYMRSLVELRTGYPSLPGPRLYRFDATHNWYAEERIYGLPINRVGDPCRVKLAITSAQQAMLKLYDATADTAPADVWVRNRLFKVKKTVHHLPEVYTATVRSEIVRIAEALATVVIQAGNSIDIKTATTHGDFQPANILIPTDPEKGTVYLIDWEYTAERVRWYDALVFALHSRSPKALSVRVRQWVSDTQSAYDSVAWCGVLLANFNPALVISSFLLEDLLLRLSDTTIPGLLKPSGGFLIFVEELSILEHNLNP